MTLNLDDRFINHLQRQAILALVNRTKHAASIDICLRVNGKDVRIEADWLKHVTFSQGDP